MNEIRIRNLLQIDSMGGGIQNEIISNIILKHYGCQFFDAVVNKNKNRLLVSAIFYYNLIKVHGNETIWIRSFNSTVTLPFDKTKGRNIAVIHHIDNNFKPAHIQFLNKIIDHVFYYALKRVDTIVVLSKFWKEHFELLGYDNVRVIYTPFNMNDFEFKDEEIVAFKHQYNLSKKPIVYLGNCQKAKGVVDAYNELKDLDVNLVTSGEKRVDIPAINFNLSYRDYLLLLKASSVVVTMSKFKEGWCRTAHEAMLCRTPVVGSGWGGMAELLDGGKQIICEDFSKLRNNVEYLLEHPEIGEKGYEYASQEKFTLEFFERKWIKLIENI